MEFWRLESPRHADGDYGHLFVNGEGEPSEDLPGIHCALCKQTWGGNRRLPVHLPPGLHARIAERSRGRPLPSPAHRELLAEVRAALVGTGQDVGPLWPGDVFQPCRWRVPSWPQASFLWPGLDLLVRDEVRELLQGAGVRGVAFVPTVLVAAGRADAGGPVPIPESGEPEDILEEVQWADDLSDAPAYFSLVPTAASRRAHGVVDRGVCAECGRPDLDWSESNSRMHRDMWTGEDIFSFGQSRWVVVTERVRALLVAAGVSNVEFVRMTA